MEFFKNKRRVAVIAAVACVVGAGAVFAAKSLSGGKPKEIIRIPEISQIERGDLSRRITADGTTRASDETSIFIELSQEVKEVFVEVGDYVEQGQLLVTYDTADTRKELNNKIKEAQISLQNADLSLEELSKPADGAELLDLQSAVVTAQKNLDDAKTEIADYDAQIKQSERNVEKAKKTTEDNEKLLAAGGIGQTEYDNSKDAYDDAVISLNKLKTDKAAKETSLQTLEIVLEKAKLNLQYGQNRLADAKTALSYQKQQNSKTTAQINLENARDELAKVTDATHSPVSGTVIECNAVEGQMLTDSTVMMKIADLTSIDLDAYVSEYDIADVKVGQKVELTSDGIAGKVYTGTVTKIEPVAESRSTISGNEVVVPIEVRMENPDERVKPGFSFDMEIITLDLSDINYIPISSIFKENDQTYVYKIGENDMLEKTEVTLGAYSETNAQFLSGLTETDRFVTTVSDNMKDGTPLSDYAVKINTNKNNKGGAESSILNGVIPSGNGMPSGGNRGGMPNGGGMPRM